MRVRVKICGVKRLEDVKAVVEAGADALGFNFVPGSLRCLTREQAKALAVRVPPFVTRVGLWVDPSHGELAATLEKVPLDAIQLHGDETPEFCAALAPRGVIKALRVRTPEDIDAIDRYRQVTQGILLDAYVPGQAGGTGETFPWEWAALARDRFPEVPIILAGGLNPGNVGEAVGRVRPYGVDVSSGVERSRGIKDPRLVEAFVRAVRDV